MKRLRFVLISIIIIVVTLIALKIGSKNEVGVWKQENPIYYAHKK